MLDRCWIWSFVYSEMNPGGESLMLLRVLSKKLAYQKMALSTDGQRQETIFERLSLNREIHQEQSNWGAMGEPVGFHSSCTGRVIWLDLTAYFLHPPDI
jgi:hypothetical protein